MTSSGAPTRSAPAALGRGVCAVVANPVAVLAPLGFGVAMAAAFVAAGAAVALLLSVPAGLRGAVRSLRDRRFSDFLEGLQGVGGSMPGTVVLVLLGILVLVLALTALAAWLRAGMTAVVAEADARAADAAELGAFRVPNAARTFAGGAAGRFGTFFGLVNLYGLAGTFVAALVLVPLVLLFTGAIAQRPALLAVAGLLVLVAIPLAIVGGAAARVAYLAAARAAVVDGADALAAVARAVELLRGAPGRAAVLYLLTIAGAMGVGFAFVLPRLVATWIAMFADGGLGPLVGITGVFFVLQMAATLAYDAAASASFVALWPQERPAAAAASGPEPLPEPTAEPIAP